MTSFASLSELRAAALDLPDGDAAAAAAVVAREGELTKPPGSLGRLEEIVGWLARWAGRGTGVDDRGLARKQAVIDRALAHHAAILADPLSVAAALGGRELAAILGATLAA